MHWSVSRGLEARPLDIVGYGDEDETDGTIAGAAADGEAQDDARTSPTTHEPLRRIARSSRLRARPQQQAAADDRLFPRHARPGARLGAGRAHRFALVPARQAEHDPRADRRARRSGAVRAVVRLCRRSLRDGRADVAGAGPPRPRHQFPRRAVAVAGDRDARHPRQGAAARSARALARHARRDRPLGAAQARHLGAAHRRLGAARQDRGGRARRQGPARDRADLAGPAAALCRAVRLARRPRRQAGDPRSGAVPPGHARARGRGWRSRRPRPARLPGRMEMGRHPRAGRRRHARGRDAGLPALFAHRRGHVGELSRPGRGAAARRRHRRRAPGGARAPGAVLQRAAAAAQPQDRHAQAPGRVPRTSACLRSPGRGRGRFARAAVLAAARAARSSSSRAWTSRASISRRWSRSRPGRNWLPPAPTPTSARCRRRSGRRHHAQAARCALPARPSEGPMVEVEARPDRSSTPC